VSTPSYHRQQLAPIHGCATSVFVFTSLSSSSLDRVVRQVLAVARPNGADLQLRQALLHSGGPPLFATIYVRTAALVGNSEQTTDALKRKKFTQLISDLAEARCTLIMYTTEEELHARMLSHWQHLMVLVAHNVPPIMRSHAQLLTPSTLVGRDPILHRLNQYVNFDKKRKKTEPKRILVLSAPPGSGKTAVLSTWCVAMSEKLARGRTVLLARFIAHDSSAQIVRALNCSLLEELRSTCGLRFPLDRSAHTNDHATWTRWLDALKFSDRRLVLVLDAVDMLGAADAKYLTFVQGGTFLSMLDLALPDHVRVIISLTPRSFAGQELARAPLKIVELPPLRYEQARQLGSLPSLEQQPRLQMRRLALAKLPPDVQTQLRVAENYANPQVLKLVLHVATIPLLPELRPIQPVDEAFYSSTDQLVDSCLLALETLVQAPVCPFVGAALSLLYVSYAGLSPRTLQQMLGISDATWAPFQVWVLAHICEQSEGLCTLTSVLLRHAIARRYLQPRLAHAPVAAADAAAVPQVCESAVHATLNKLETEERLRRLLYAHFEKTAEIGNRNIERENLFQLWKLESLDDLKGFVSDIGTLRKLCTSSSCDLLIHCVSMARAVWKVPIKIEWDALEYLAFASHGSEGSVMHTIRSLLAVADVLRLLGELVQAEVFYRAALGGWLGGDKAVCLAKLARVQRRPRPRSAFVQSPPSASAVFVYLHLHPSTTSTA
jgi:hypothetical protein